MPDYSKNFLTSMTGYTPLVEEQETVSENKITFSNNQQANVPKFDSSIAKQNTKQGDQVLIGEVEERIETGGDPVDPKKLPPAERAIVEKYIKLGYEVSKDANGKLQFSKGGVMASKIAENEGATTSADLNKIPAPDYKDATSRLNYAKKFTQKYGSLMEKRGDTPLRINEAPAWGTDTSINLAKKSASQFDIDPVLFYASTMEEGMSGLYPHKIKGREKEGDLVNSSGNKDYPVSGLWSFGLDSFSDKYESLVKKGYLPKDFDKNFIIGSDASSKDKGESALFKNTDAAVQASAAMLKTHYDDIDQYSEKNKIPLSKKDRDFFALASFNAGEGVGRQMLSEYYKNNYLKDGSYLKKRPTSGSGLKESSYEKVYENVIRRIQMSDALKKEGLTGG